jgi:hypothetical protein
MGKVKKFPNQFNIAELNIKLSHFEPMSAYSFNKRNNPNELDNTLSLLPINYVKNLKDKIQSVDFLYSGSTEQPLILGIIVGRLDKFKGQEAYDLDFFHIAPESGSLDDYFMKQFLHIEDDGKRLSSIIHSSSFSSHTESVNNLYNAYLTGSTTSSSFEEFEKEKPKHLEIFKKSFEK